jgi:hypothetical protein
MILAKIRMLQCLDVVGVVKNLVGVDAHHCDFDDSKKVAVVFVMQLSGDQPSALALLVAVCIELGQRSFALFGGYVNKQEHLLCVDVKHDVLQ